MHNSISFILTSQSLRQIALFYTVKLQQITKNLIYAHPYNVLVQLTNENDEQVEAHLHALVQKVLH